MNRLCLKTIALILAGSFLIQDISWAAPVLNSIAAPKELWQAPAKIHISPEFGRLRGTFTGEEPKLLIHIQDAHTNLSAQENIASILEGLIKQYGVHTVFLEGGTKDDSVSFLRPLAPAIQRKQVGRKYLMNGMISGAEYLDLTSDLEISLIGVEERELYSRNLNAYATVAKGRERTLAYLGEISKRVASLKRRMYPADLLALDETVLAFEKSQKSFTEYFEKLSAQARRSGVNLLGYPHFLSLAELENLESGIDFEKANKEQVEAVRFLKTKGFDALAGLHPGKVRSGSQSSLRFYMDLTRIAKEKGLEPSSLKELLRYTDYLQRFESIDPEMLSKEARTIRTEIFHEGLKGEGLRLYEISEALLNLKTLFSLKATKEDFEEYLSRKKDGFFHGLHILAFLNKKLLDLGNDGDVLPYLPILEDGGKNIEDFYRATTERDEVMLRKTFKRMEEQKISVAVLITGGYHTQNLKELMREKKISYAVVSPNVREETNIRRYEKLLLSEMGGERFLRKDGSVKAAAEPKSLALKTAVERTAVPVIAPIVAELSRGARLAADKNGDQKLVEGLLSADKRDIDASLRKLDRLDQRTIHRVTATVLEAVDLIPSFRVGSSQGYSELFIDLKRGGEIVGGISFDIDRDRKTLFKYVNSVPEDQRGRRILPVLYRWMTTHGELLSWYAGWRITNRPNTTSNSSDVKAWYRSGLEQPKAHYARKNQFGEKRYVIEGKFLLADPDRRLKNILLMTAGILAVSAFIFKIFKEDRSAHPADSSGSGQASGARLAGKVKKKVPDDHRKMILVSDPAIGKYFSLQLADPNVINNIIAFSGIETSDPADWYKGPLHFGRIKRDGRYRLVVLVDPETANGMRDLFNLVANSEYEQKFKALIKSETPLKSGKVIKPGSNNSETAKGEGIARTERPEDRPRTPTATESARFLRYANLSPLFNQTKDLLPIDFYNTSARRKYLAILFNQHRQPIDLEDLVRHFYTTYFYKPDEFIGLLQERIREEFRTESPKGSIRIQSDLTSQIEPIRSIRDTLLSDFRHAENLQRGFGAGIPDREGIWLEPITKYQMVFDLTKEILDGLTEPKGYRDFERTLHRVYPGIKDNDLNEVLYRAPYNLKLHPKFIYTRRHDTGPGDGQDAGEKAEPATAIRPRPAKALSPAPSAGDIAEEAFEVIQQDVLPKLTEYVAADGYEINVEKLNDLAEFIRSLEERHAIYQAVILYLDYLVRHRNNMTSMTAEYVLSLLRYDRQSIYGEYDPETPKETMIPRRPLSEGAESIIKEYQSLVSRHEKWVPAVVVFGSARIGPGHHYYERSVEIGRELWRGGLPVRTGAAHNLMEGPMLGYTLERPEEFIGEARYQTQGVQIELPFEQMVNPYVEEVIHFDYFLTRKIALWHNSVGAIALPGGVGTMDETFEVWRRGSPLVFFGRDFWGPILEAFRSSWRLYGLEQDVERRGHFLVTDDPKQAVQYIKFKKDEHKLFTERKIDLTDITSQVGAGLMQVKALPKAVSFVGRPRGSKKYSEPLDAATDLAERLAGSGSAIRIGSRDVLLNSMMTRAARRGWSKNIQAVLYVPKGSPLTPNEKLVGKQLVKLQDESAHQLVHAANTYAYVFVPGGVGTMNKLFDLIQIMQLSKATLKPIILIGKDFWEPILRALKAQMVNGDDSSWDAEGKIKKISTVNADDFDRLVRVVDDADAAMEVLALSGVLTDIRSGARLVESSEEPNKSIGYYLDNPFYFKPIAPPVKAQRNYVLDRTQGLEEYRIEVSETDRSDGDTVLTADIIEVSGDKDRISNILMTVDHDNKLVYIDQFYPRFPDKKSPQYSEGRGRNLLYELVKKYDGYEIIANASEAFQKSFKKMGEEYGFESVMTALEDKEALNEVIKVNMNIYRSISISSSAAWSSATIYGVIRGRAARVMEDGSVRKKRLLILDDKQSFSEAARGIFKKEYPHIDTVSNLEDAMNAVRNNPKYDLAILDVDLSPTIWTKFKKVDLDGKKVPIRKAGFEFSKWLARNKKAPRAIILNSSIFERNELDAALAYWTGSNPARIQKEAESHGIVVQPKSETLKRNLMNRPVVAVMGAPGAGKTTTARKLSEALRLPLISVGDLSRRAKAMSQKKRRLSELLERELKRDPAAYSNGFILDFNPRRPNQFDAVTEYLKGRLYNLVEFVEVSADENISRERILDRPARPTETKRRPANRLRFFRDRLAPIIADLKEKHIFYPIDNNGSEEELDDQVDGLVKHLKRRSFGARLSSSSGSDKSSIREDILKYLERKMAEEPGKLWSAEEIWKGLGTGKYSYSEVYKILDRLGKAPLSGIQRQTQMHTLADGRNRPQNVYRFSFSPSDIRWNGLSVDEMPGADDFINHKNITFDQYVFKNSSTSPKISLRAQKEALRAYEFLRSNEGAFSLRELHQELTAYFGEDPVFENSNEFRRALEWLDQKGFPILRRDQRWSVEGVSRKIFFVMDPDQWPLQIRKAWKDLEKNESPAAIGQRIKIVLRILKEFYGLTAAEQSDIVNINKINQLIEGRSGALQERLDQQLEKVQKNLGIAAVQLRTGKSRSLHAIHVHRVLHRMTTAQAYRALRNLTGKSRRTVAEDLKQTGGAKGNDLKALLDLESGESENSYVPQKWPKLAWAYEVPVQDVFYLVARTSRERALKFMQVGAWLRFNRFQRGLTQEQAVGQLREDEKMSVPLLSMIESSAWHLTPDSSAILRKMHGPVVDKLASRRWADLEDPPQEIRTPSSLVSAMEIIARGVGVFKENRGGAAYKEFIRQFKGDLERLKSAEGPEKLTDAVDSALRHAESKEDGREQPAYLKWKRALLALGSLIEFSQSQPMKLAYFQEELLKHGRDVAAESRDRLELPSLADFFERSLRRYLAQDPYEMLRLMAEYKSYGDEDALKKLLRVYQENKEQFSENLDQLAERYVIAREFKAGMERPGRSGARLAEEEERPNELVVQLPHNVHLRKALLWLVKPFYGSHVIEHLFKLPNNLNQVLDVPEDVSKKVINSIISRIPIGLSLRPSVSVRLDPEDSKNIWSETWLEELESGRYDDDPMLYVRILFLSIFSLGRDSERFKFLYTQLVSRYLAARQGEFDRRHIPATIKKIEIPWLGVAGGYIPAYLALPENRPAKGAPIVVLFHGLDSVKEDPLYDREENKLLKRGVAVLRVDSLKHGENDAAFVKSETEIQFFVRSVIEYLTDPRSPTAGLVDPDRIGVMGLSLGGYLALKTVADTETNRHIKGAVAINPPIKATFNEPEIVLGEYREVLAHIFGVSGEDHEEVLRVSKKLVFTSEEEKTLENTRVSSVIFLSQNDPVIARKDRSDLMRIARKNPGIRIYSSQKAGHHFMEDYTRLYRDSFYHFIALFTDPEPITLKSGWKDIRMSLSWDNFYSWVLRAVFSFDVWVISISSLESHKYAVILVGFILAFPAAYSIYFTVRSLFNISSSSEKMIYLFLESYSRYLSGQSGEWAEPAANRLKPAVRGALDELMSRYFLNHLSNYHPMRVSRARRLDTDISELFNGFLGSAVLKNRIQRPAVNWANEKGLRFSFGLHGLRGAANVVIQRGEGDSIKEIAIMPSNTFSGVEAEVFLRTLFEWLAAKGFSDVSIKFNTTTEQAALHGRKKEFMRSFLSKYLKRSENGAAAPRGYSMDDSHIKVYLNDFNWRPEKALGARLSTASNIAIRRPVAMETYTEKNRLKYLDEYTKQLVKNLEGNDVAVDLGLGGEVSTIDGIIPSPTFFELADLIHGIHPDVHLAGFDIVDEIVTLGNAYLRKREDSVKLSINLGSFEHIREKYPDGVGLIRAANVLMHYPKDDRERARAVFNDSLKEGGFYIEAASSGTKIYQKIAGELTPHLLIHKEAAYPNNSWDVLDMPVRDTSLIEKEYLRRAFQEREIFAGLFEKIRDDFGFDVSREPEGLLYFKLNPDGSFKKTDRSGARLAEDLDQPMLTIEKDPGETQNEALYRQWVAEASDNLREVFSHVTIQRALSDKIWAQLHTRTGRTIRLTIQASRGGLITDLTMTPKGVLSTEEASELFRSMIAWLKKKGFTKLHLDITYGAKQSEDFIKAALAPWTPEGVVSSEFVDHEEGEARFAIVQLNLLNQKISGGTWLAENEIIFKSPGLIESDWSEKSFVELDDNAAGPIDSYRQAIAQPDLINMLLRQEGFSLDTSEERLMSEIFMNAVRGVLKARKRPKVQTQVGVSADRKVIRITATQETILDEDWEILKKSAALLPEELEDEISRVQKRLAKGGIGLRGLSLMLAEKNILLVYRRQADRSLITSLYLESHGARLAEKHDQLVDLNNKTEAPSYVTAYISNNTPLDHLDDLGFLRIPDDKEDGVLNLVPVYGLLQATGNYAYRDATFDRNIFYTELVLFEKLIEKGLAGVDEIFHAELHPWDAPLARLHRMNHEIAEALLDNDRYLEGVNESRRYLGHLRSVKAPELSKQTLNDVLQFATFQDPLVYYATMNKPVGVSAQTGLINMSLDFLDRLPFYGIPFVLGHEIGHIALGESMPLSTYENYLEDNDPESLSEEFTADDLMMANAIFQTLEYVADRLGYLAANAVWERIGASGDPQERLGWIESAFYRARESSYHADKLALFPDRSFNAVSGEKSFSIISHPPLEARLRRINNFIERGVTPYALPKEPDPSGARLSEKSEKELRWEISAKSIRGHSLMDSHESMLAVVSNWSTILLYLRDSDRMDPAVLKKLTALEKSADRYYMRFVKEIHSDEAPKNYLTSVNFLKVLYAFEKEVKENKEKLINGAIPKYRDQLKGSIERLTKYISQSRDILEAHLQLVEGRLETTPSAVKPFIEASVQAIDARRDIMQDFRARRLQVRLGDFPADFPQVNIQTMLLRRGIAEIIKNASEAASQNKVEDPYLIVSAVTDPGRSEVLLKFEDNVGGMPKEFFEDGEKPGKPKVFDLGVSTKDGGLGMAELYEIIRLHKGRIGVIPNDRSGTTFTIRLPFAKASGAWLADRGAVIQALGIEEGLLQKGRIFLSSNEYKKLSIHKEIPRAADGEPLEGELIVMRHGQSRSNEGNIFSGQTDISLTETGHDQAKGAGRLIQKLLGTKFSIDEVYVSDLLRAMETLLGVMTGMGLDPKKQTIYSHPAIKERHYGALAGVNRDLFRDQLARRIDNILNQSKDLTDNWSIAKLIDEVVRRWNEPVDVNTPLSHEVSAELAKRLIIKWRRGYENSPPPDASGFTESLKDTRDRASGFFNKEVWPGIVNGKKILLIAHGSSLRAILMDVLSLGPDDMNFTLPLATPIRIRFNNNGSVRAVTILEPEGRSAPDPANRDAFIKILRVKKTPYELVSGARPASMDKDELEAEKYIAHAVTWGLSKEELERIYKEASTHDQGMDGIEDKIIKRIHGLKKYRVTYSYVSADEILPLEGAIYHSTTLGALKLMITESNGEIDGGSYFAIAPDYAVGIGKRFADTGIGSTPTITLMFDVNRLRQHPAKYQVSSNTNIFSDKSIPLSTLTDASKKMVVEELAKLGKKDKYYLIPLEKIYKALDYNSGARLADETKRVRLSGQEIEVNTRVWEKIEYARPEDAARIFELMQHLPSPEMTGFTSAEEISYAINEQEDAYGRINAFLVYRDEGKILAYLLGRIDTNRKMAEILQIATAEEARREGAAKTLHAWFMRESEENHGSTKFSEEVDNPNAEGIPLAFGFRRLRREGMPIWTSQQDQFVSPSMSDEEGMRLILRQTLHLQAAQFIEFLMNKPNRLIEQFIRRANISVWIDVNDLSLPEAEYNKIMNSLWQQYPQLYLRLRSIRSLDEGSWRRSVELLSLAMLPDIDWVMGGKPLDADYDLFEALSDSFMDYWQDGPSMRRNVFESVKRGDLNPLKLYLHLRLSNEEDFGERSDDVSITANNDGVLLSDSLENLSVDYSRLEGARLTENRIRKDIPMDTGASRHSYGPDEYIKKLLEAGELDPLNHAIEIGIGLDKGYLKNPERGYGPAPTLIELFLILRESNPDVKFTGIDINAEAVDQMRTYISKEIENKNILGRFNYVEQAYGTILSQLKNLEVVRGGFEKPAELYPGTVDLIRVANVSQYYSSGQMKDAREKLAVALRPNGILMIVSNGYFATYRKLADGKLVPHEFSYWFGIHEGREKKVALKIMTELGIYRKDTQKFIETLIKTEKSISRDYGDGGEKASEHFNKLGYQTRSNLWGYITFKLTIDGSVYRKKGRASLLPPSVARLAVLADDEDDYRIDWAIRPEKPAQIEAGDLTLYTDQDVRRWMPSRFPIEDVIVYKNAPEEIEIHIRDFFRNLYIFHITRDWKNPKAAMLENGRPAYRPEYPAELRKEYGGSLRNWLTNIIFKNLLEQGYESVSVNILSDDSIPFFESLGFVPDAKNGPSSMIKDLRGARLGEAQEASSQIIPSIESIGSRLAEALKPKTKLLVPILLSAVITLFSITPADAATVNVEVIQVNDFAAVTGPRIYQGSIDIAKVREEAKGTRGSAKLTSEASDAVAEEKMRFNSAVSALPEDIQKIVYPTDIEVPVTLFDGNEKLQLALAHMKAVKERFPNSATRFYLTGSDGFDEARLSALQTMIAPYGDMVFLGKAPRDRVTARLVNPEQAAALPMDGTIQIPVEPEKEGSILGRAILVVAKGMALLLQKAGQFVPGELTAQGISDPTEALYNTAAAERADKETIRNIALGIAEAAVLVRHRLRPVLRELINEISVLANLRRAFQISA